MFFGEKWSSFFSLIGNFFVSFLAFFVFLITVTLFTVIVTIRSRDLFSKPSWLKKIKMVHEQKKDLEYLYTSKIAVVGRTNDSSEHVYDVEMVFGFTKKDKALTVELDRRKLEVQDLLRSFFGLRSIGELKTKNEWQLKGQLIERMDIFLRQGKIQEVLFLRFDVI